MAPPPTDIARQNVNAELAIYEPVEGCAQSCNAFPTGVGQLCSPSPDFLSPTPDFLSRDQHIPTHVTAYDDDESDTTVELYFTDDMAKLWLASHNDKKDTN